MLKELEVYERQPAVAHSSFFGAFAYFHIAVVSTSTFCKLLTNYCRLQALGHFSFSFYELWIYRFLVSRCFICHGKFCWFHRKCPSDKTGLIWLRHVLNYKFKQAVDQSIVIWIPDSSKVCFGFSVEGSQQVLPGRSSLCGRGTANLTAYTQVSGGVPLFKQCSYPWDQFYRNDSTLPASNTSWLNITWWNRGVSSASNFASIAATVINAEFSGFCMDREAERTKLLFVRICREYLAPQIGDAGKDTKGAPSWVWRLHVFPTLFKM